MFLSSPPATLPNGPGNADKVPNNSRDFMLTLSKASLFSLYALFKVLHSAVPSGTLCNSFLKALTFSVRVNV